MVRPEVPNGYRFLEVGEPEPDLGYDDNGRQIELLFVRKDDPTHSWDWSAPEPGSITRKEAVFWVAVPALVDCPVSREW